MILLHNKYRWNKLRAKNSAIICNIKDNNEHAVLLYHLWEKKMHE